MNDPIFNIVNAGDIHAVPPIILNLPPNRSILHITPNLTIHSSHPVPNRWRRFWYWALLNWKWEKL
jgi:hypothetical protein